MAVATITASPGTEPIVRVRLAGPSGPAVRAAGARTSTPSGRSVVTRIVAVASSARPRNVAETVRATGPPSPPAPAGGRVELMASDIPARSDPTNCAVAAPPASRTATVSRTLAARAG